MRTLLKYYNKTVLSFCILIIIISNGISSSDFPSLEDNTFFADVRVRLDASHTKIFVGLSPNAESGFSYYVVFKAEDMKMRPFVVPVSGVGTVVDDVVTASDNSDACLVINGALFGYNTSNVSKGGPDQEPMVTVGNIVRNSVVISTNASLGARRFALAKYWIAQEYGMSDDGHALSYFFSEPPPGTHGDPPLCSAAIGGLFALILPTGIQRSTLSVYEAFRLKDGNIASASLGYLSGFNIVGVDRQSGMIIIATKQHKTYGSIFAARDTLSRIGVDVALITDGGASEALWVKGYGYLSKGDRHIRSRADKNNTVTNYLIFAPRS